jgi:hypothetical protein
MAAADRCRRHVRNRIPKSHEGRFERRASLTRTPDRRVESVGERSDSPSPKCLQDWGGLQGTAGDSRGRTWQQIARRVEPDLWKSCAITSYEMRRHGFDSRRLHHLPVRRQHLWDSWPLSGFAGWSVMVHPFSCG